NWKKLEQYIFDERESFEMRGTNRVPIWGERRTYTWYIKDGFFVRSPLKVNGATVGEADRRKAEDAYLKQAQKRETRGRAGQAEATSDPVEPSDRDASQDLG